MAARCAERFFIVVVPLAGASHRPLRPPSFSRFAIFQPPGVPSDASSCHWKGPWGLFYPLLSLHSFSCSVHSFVDGKCESNLSHMVDLTRFSNGNGIFLLEEKYRSNFPSSPPHGCEILSREARRDLPRGARIIWDETGSCRESCGQARSVGEDEAALCNRTGSWCHPSRSLFPLSLSSATVAARTLGGAPPLRPPGKACDLSLNPCAASGSGRDPGPSFLPQLSLLVVGLALAFLAGPVSNSGGNCQQRGTRSLLSSSALKLPARAVVVLFVLGGHHSELAAGFFCCFGFFLGCRSSCAVVA